VLGLQLRDIALDVVKHAAVLQRLLCNLALVIDMQF
jgi:hypothetical protein